MSEAERSLLLAQQRSAEARSDARQLAVQNRKLQETLTQARQRLTVASQRLEQMSKPPLYFATVLSSLDAEGTVEAFIMGRRMRISLDPALPKDLHTNGIAIGQRVLANDAMVIVGLADSLECGEVMQVTELLDSDHIIVSGSGSENLLVQISDVLKTEGLRHGESVLVHRPAGIALQKVNIDGVEDLFLDEIPNVDYNQIGGLDAQIQLVRDAVELPFLHRDVYRSYQLAAPKGILLYGPPGTGKTMIAKAVAASLAKNVSESTGGAERSYFLNVKGPELLNKYVGETERQIRVIFQRAREHAHSGAPVIVFFDEMDSLFRMRGSGVSSDVENTIVPQLLSEIDGVESLENVIIIGASNREDLIDPAILRPGRLDIKIKLNRPDANAAVEIFGTYLTSDTPLHPSELAKDENLSATRQRLISETVAYMYAQNDENRFIEVTYASGAKEVLYFSDFASGAMIRNIVDKAKKAAVKAEILTGERGITQAQLWLACKEELRENEDLPNTTNPDEWARVSGRKGEQITFIRTLVNC